MIARIIAFSARNPFLIVVLIIAIVAGGIWALYNTPLDAIPDLSDVQVIVLTEWEDRSPDIIEDQITYPITTQLLATPGVKAVRSTSFFGFSLIYVIFEDGTDIYWARSRVLEYLSGIAGSLPDGVAPKLGPDATGVGWGLQYVLIDRTGRHDLAQLRTLQDWHVQYQLQAVPGVAEVAAVGGFVKQYQVTLDPDKLLAYRIPINRVVERIRRNNQEVGGRVLEFTGADYMVRGRGYFASISDIEEVGLGAQQDGTPVRVRDVGFVQLGPDIRRGVVDYNALGDTAGGVVVVRFGESTYDVLQNVKRAIEETVNPSLPEGVELHIVYDRSQLIENSVATLRRVLIEESAIVSLIIVVFLLHFRSALVAILTLPLAVLLAFIAMRGINLTSNIMSLGGIAIAVGTIVDSAIVMIENAHKHIEHEQAKPEQERRRRSEIVIAAAQQVGPSLFFALLIITVSFLPIFALEDQEGRLFKPLAWTAVFSLFFAALLAITVGPLLIVLLIRGRIPPEEKNPINRFLIWLYRPIARWALRWRYSMVLLGVLVMLATVPVYLRLGSEFMPPLWEESIMYMPVALPGASIHTMREAIQEQDRILMEFPEVASVLAKAGRAETATDPAPLEMVETIINLKPRDQWRSGLTSDDLIAEMDQALRKQQIGFSNMWTMPIKGRIDMLATGIRTPIGVKVFGPDLDEISRIAMEIEQHVGMIEGTRSAFAERVAEGYYLDITIHRERIARYGLAVADVHEVIQSAVGGANVTTTIEGRERFPVNVRYGRDFRTDLWELRRVLVETPIGPQVPLEELADLELTSGANMIKSEAARLVGYVFIDIAGRDPGRYVEEARAMVQREVEIPSGYSLEWSGAYQAMQRANRRLMYVVPLTLIIVFILLYLNTRSLVQSLIVVLAIPFSLTGAFLLLYLLGYNLSVAVWVGIIALAGVAAETGIVTLLYIEVAYHHRKQQGRMNRLADLEDAVVEGAVQRLRPQVMTTVTLLIALMPIMWSTGTGADVMKRIAAPMIGGAVTSLILVLLIYPALYSIWKWWTEVRATERQTQDEARH